MDPTIVEALKTLVPAGYVDQGVQAYNHHEALISHLLAQKNMQKEAWSDMTINILMDKLAIMDGPGEYHMIDCIAERNFGINGYLNYNEDSNPFSAGTAAMIDITNSLLLDVIQRAGATSTRRAIVVPTATGMALTMAILALATDRRKARYVLWTRIDQKSGIKAILTAGYRPLVIEPVKVGDELVTNVKMLTDTVKDVGSENIACILTTTSCFAPRTPDNIEEVAKICAEFDIPHLVNNAYGIQSSICMHRIQQGQRYGRVDAFVQSADKNFMVPVGGAIIAGMDKELVNNIGKRFGGEGSIAPVLDLLITLLSMGKDGFKKLYDERKLLFRYLNESLEVMLPKHGQRLLTTPHNNVSLGITLKNYAEPTMIGSMLFKRNISGTRVVDVNKSKSVCDIEFKSYGAHFDDYQCSYVTAAVAIGCTRSEIDTFVDKLDQCLAESSKKEKSKEVIAANMSDLNLKD